MDNVEGLVETPKTNLLNSSLRSTYKLTAPANQSLQPSQEGTDATAPPNRPTSPMPQKPVGQNSLSRSKDGVNPPPRKRKRVASQKDDTIEGAILTKLNSSESSRPKPRPTVRFEDLGTGLAAENATGPNQLFCKVVLRMCYRM